MEIKGFCEHLYTLKKNYTFKKVYANYGSDSYKQVLWAIKKPKKIKNGQSFSYHSNINFIVEDYDISRDKEIESLYVIHSLQSGKVTFRPSVDVWLEIAHKTVTINSLSQDEKMDKIMSILKQIPKDKWESFFIRFIYGFNHSSYNTFLLAFLLEISRHITEEDIVSIDPHRPELPKICQFYDKFKYKFTDEEKLLLWINLIKKEEPYIVESIDSHAIAHYLIEIFKDRERDQLISFFPLMKEKLFIKNNKDNPFDFERHNNHKRHLFEFHNEQMTKNLSTQSPGWSYQTFKEIADKFLLYMADAYVTPQPQFLSKPNSPIYSAIVYAESPEQIKMFRELLFDTLGEFFINQNICEENKDHLLEDENFKANVLKTIISKHITHVEENEDNNFKL